VTATGPLTWRRWWWLVLLAGSLADADPALRSAAGERARVAGIDVVTYATAVKDVVVIVGALPAGDAMAGSGNLAVPTLMAMMLDRGTRSQDRFAIADALESVGAEITYEAGAQSLEVRAKCLQKDLPLVLGVIAAELRTPALQSAEFAKARQQFIGSLEQSLQNTDARAEEAFGSAIFPIGHPNHPHPVADYLAAAKTVTLNQLKDFHSRYYGPAHMTLVLVGDVSTDSARSEVARDFTGWSGGEDYLSAAAPATPTSPPEPSAVVVPIAGKSSVSVLLGEASGLRYRDPDALALRVGTAILGHGFTSRLMSVVRDQEGLTYGISAGLADDAITDGAWEISATFAPSLLDKGVASTRRELQRWWSEGVSETELNLYKQDLVGSYEVGLSTTAGVAEALILALQRGYDIDWLTAYPEAVKALSRAQVNAAIKTHLDPKRMVLIEAGSLPR